LHNKINIPVDQTVGCLIDHSLVESSVTFLTRSWLYITLSCRFSYFNDVNKKIAEHCLVSIGSFCFCWLCVFFTIMCNICSDVYVWDTRFRKEFLFYLSIYINYSWIKILYFSRFTPPRYLQSSIFNYIFLVDIFVVDIILIISL